MAYLYDRHYAVFYNRNYNCYHDTYAHRLKSGEATRNSQILALLHTYTYRQT